MIGIVLVYFIVVYIETKSGVRNFNISKKPDFDEKTFLSTNPKVLKYQNEIEKINSYSRFINEIDQELNQMQANKINMTYSDFKFKTFNNVSVARIL